MTSFIHGVLKRRSKEANWPYISSILIKNKDIPLFESRFGQLDYDWLLKVTKNRQCKEINPCVIRYVNGKNLSLNPEYRKREFYMSLLEVDDDINTVRSLYGTRARYFYIIGNMKMARFYFWRAKIDWKTILYILTSHNRKLSKVIIKKFGVFG